MPPGRGRPSTYTDEAGEQVIELMGQGYSLTAAAGKLGVSRQTLYRWGEERPDFRDALNHAKAASAAWWEDRAQEIAQGGEGNAAVVIFGLKNRVSDEWRDKQDIDVTHRYADLSDEELEEQIRQRQRELDNGDG